MFCEDRYLDSIPIGVVMVDKKGVIKSINNTAAEILNVSSNKAVGLKIEELFPNSKVFCVVESGERLVYQKEELNNELILACHTPLYEEGELIGAVSTFQKFSGIEKIFNELNILPKEFDAIIESSYDGIVVANSEGKLLKINSAYERITELKPEDLVGRYVKDVENENTISKSATLEVLKKKEPVTIKQNIVTGKEMLVTGSPIFDEHTGKIKYVICNCRDLTELYKLQKKLEETHELTNKYYSEIQKLRAQQTRHDDIIARSPEMQEVIEMAFKVAEVDCNVLLLGETGVGKDVIAKFIHNNGERRKGPFIKVNCGAIPENLLESEFFGYEEGAFTGSKKGGKPGSFELADGGTLFLDEIGELSLNLQVKLLNILQDQVFKRVGGTKNITTDVRIIAATNRNLEDKVTEGKFRSDLYYRLNVVNIKIPPLRKRKEDILPLLQYLMDKYNKKYGKDKEIPSHLIDAFYNYHWPGNIRELENITERVVVTSKVDEIVDNMLNSEENSDYLRNEIEKEARKADVISPEEEKRKLINLYEEYKSTRKVAKIMGVSQSTVVRKMKKYNIEPSKKEKSF